MHALVACVALPLLSSAVGSWEHAWEEPTTELPAPEAPPSSLRFVPLDDPAAPPDRRGRRVLWLRTTVDSAGADDVLFIPKAFVALTAYVDGRRVTGIDDYDEAAGTPWYVVPLPRGESVVTVRLFSLYSKIGLPRPVQLGARADLVTEMVRDDLGRLALVPLFLVAALLCVVLGVVSRSRRGYVALAAYLLGVGVWTLFHTRTKQLLLDGTPLWFWAWWLSVPLASLGVAVFIRSTFGDGPRGFFRWMERAYLVVAPTSLIILVLPLPYDTVGIPFLVFARLLGLIGFLASGVVLSVRAWRGDADARVFTIGFLSTAFANVHDYAVALGALPGDRLFGHWGLAGLSVALLVLVVRRYQTLHASLQTYTAELERAEGERGEMLRDLHDGLGGITTNIRMLAERGTRRRDDDERDRVLSTIERLAVEGVAEVRALMRSIDLREEGWEGLAAALRRTARDRLEAHDVSLTFVADVAVDAAQPSPRLTLNVLRVVHESLTNIAKHAEATRVRLELRVARDRMELTIEDDGKGLGENPGTGRGLAHMRTRARALGGTLDVEDTADGTRVAMTAPLGET